MTSDPTAGNDAALAVLVLLAVAVAVVTTGVHPSPFFLVLGAGATVAFELVAARNPAAVRRQWRRPAVRTSAVVLALALVAAGAVLAPSRTLSTVAGALLAYLCLLALVRTGTLPSQSNWFRDEG